MQAAEEGIQCPSLQFPTLQGLQVNESEGKYPLTQAEQA